jgi:UDP-N-acetylmuramoyl-tripeptide--D-alanyl-D-alanine ligase
LKVEFDSTMGGLAAAGGGRLIQGSPGAAIHTITTDSRMLGRDNLFIPIIGEKFDGHRFIAELAGRGELTGFFTMRGEDGAIAREYGISAVLCEDTLQSYGRIASRHRDDIDPVVVGITGTNGKTTTKEIVSAVLATEKRCLKNEKNYNNEIGLPFTMLGLRREHEVLVVEMGMNHAGELDRLSRISRPDIALITNVGEGHLEFLGSVENVALAKSEIMHGMKPGSLIFINGDTQCFDILHSKARDMGLEIRTFGLGKKSDIHAGAYRLFSGGLEVDISGDVYRMPLYGIHNVYNCLAAVAIAMEFGINPANIKGALGGFSNVGMRSQIIEGDFILINDSYNSNPLSSRYALISASMVFPDRRRIAVLSDMKELGESSAEFHREMGRDVAGNGFSLLFVWGEMSAHIADGAIRAGMGAGSVLTFEKKDDLIKALHENIKKGDVVLVKGSRSMKMEEVAGAITRS